MPFYDYRCNQCGKTFEVSHGMGGKPKDLKCPFCGASDLQRVFHPVGTKRSDENSTSSSSCSSCSSGTCSACG